MESFFLSYRAFQQYRIRAALYDQRCFSGKSETHPPIWYAILSVHFPDDDFVIEGKGQTALGMEPALWRAFEDAIVRYLSLSGEMVGTAS